MSNTKSVGAKVTPDQKDGLEELAYEYSIPGNRVTVSDVIRLSVRRLLSDPPSSTEFWDKASYDSEPTQTQDTSAPEADAE